MIVGVSLGNALDPFNASAVICPVRSKITDLVLNFIYKTVLVFIRKILKYILDRYNSSKKRIHYEYVQPLFLC